MYERDEDYYEYKRDEAIDERLCEGVCIRCCKPRVEYTNCYVPTTKFGFPAKCPECAPYNWELKQGDE